MAKSVCLHSIGMYKSTVAFWSAATDRRQAQLVAARPMRHVQPTTFFPRCDAVPTLWAMSTVYNAALKRETGAGKRRVADEGEGEKGVRRNKQRVLVLPSRGVTTRMRHLVNDVEALLPHAKKGASRYLIN